MKNFLGYIFTFLLGIVLIIPWVYNIIIYYRSGGEYVASGLPGNLEDLNLAGIIIAVLFIKLIL